MSLKKKLKTLMYKNKLAKYFYKGLRLLYHRGFRTLWMKMTQVLGRNRVRHLPKKKDLQTQEQYVFSKELTFSIVVPLYNTPRKFLEEMIASVFSQTYKGWELCLADASAPDNKKVEEICRAWCEKDKRILYKRLSKNEGIAGNTNTAIDMATGEYIGLLDHDDLLSPIALFEMRKKIDETNADFLYSDEAVFEKSYKKPRVFHFKPDFAIDTLRGNNYICHFTTFKKSLMEESGGGFRKEYDGAQDHELFLRLSEKAKNIQHIPKVLYYWRAHQLSTASKVEAKPYALEAGKNAVIHHLERLGLDGEVYCVKGQGTVYRVSYKIKDNPLVSILIPNKDHIDDLDKCITSILEKSTYQNIEIIIIENNSEKEGTFSYYKKWEAHDKVRLVTWEGPFNYPSINRFGVEASKGEHLLFLNNDTEVITPTWIEEMLMFVQRKDVACAGAKLYFPDDTIQHAGIGLGLFGLAAHYYKGADRGNFGYMGRLSIVQDLSCVTGACMMIRRDVFLEMGGMNEEFAVAFNDVDICVRMREAGYLIVFTPFSELYHYESKSRGYEDTPEKKERFSRELKLFLEKWGDVLKKGDPYYNPNLSLDRDDFTYLLKKR